MLSRTFLWFTLLSLFWIIFEYAFLDLVFPSLMAPVCMFALAIAFVVTLGYPIGFFWAVGSALLFDLMRTGTITWVSLSLMLFSGATSFLMTRFSLDSTRSRSWLIALWVLAITGITLLGVSWPELPSWSTLVAAFVLWFPVSASVRHLERWLSSTSLLEFRGMRHT